MDSNNKYGLTEADINRIVAVINKNKKVEKIILFGSRAKGTYNNGSDVDLSLTGSSLKLNDILDISNNIDQLALPYKFDLLIHHRIKEEALLNHIRNVGVTLYVNKRS